MKNQPIILFRSSYDTEEELEVARKYFAVEDNRDLIILQADRLVIGRYSVLPYYKDLSEALHCVRSSLINSLREYSWIANFEYYETVQEYTPKTYFSLYELKLDETYSGPYVVKGLTNSKKYNWNTEMFAKDYEAAFKVTKKLNSDGLVGTQQLIYRQYVPLKTYEVGINGVRFTNEWRFFFYKNRMLSYGYYWSSASDETLKKATIDEDGINFAKSIANRVCEYAKFFVLDVAETEQGKWILIEINDASMSGISENNPHTLYSNLKKELENDQETA